MLSKIKDLFLFCYEATEKMEEKAAHFEEERTKRMESFREDRDAARDRAKAHIEDMKSEMQGQIKDTLNHIGVATKDEVEDIKKLLTDLSKKVDSLSK